MEKKIRPDSVCFDEIKESSRPAYERTWGKFRKLNPEHNFDEVPPGEELFLKFFKHLREVKKAASSSMWTHYSEINNIFRRKYSMK